ncbi:spoIIIJ-associated protein [Shouchella lonarensis]|uniref:RNA-binding protein KhpB n=2 Tax=Shouchella lonarensis TaxID=1464122 RepID=A0A1G6NP28_9BACI|nr:spoIIIJ-associated protein [Shouchella lonarensis]
MKGESGMVKHTVTGRTIEEAVSKALEELSVPKEQLMYKVISQPQKGLLRLFRPKQAVIEVEVRPQSADVAHSFLVKTLKQMNIEAKINVNQSGRRLQMILDASNEADQGRLIGKKGQTLDGLELLTNLATGHADGVNPVRVDLDAGEYRLKREEALKYLAFRVSKKVQTVQQPVVLEPMPARERKVIHMTLANEAYVKTRSEGEGSRRHVVVEPK